MNYSGYESFVEKAVKVIHAARVSLFVSAWTEEVILLADAVAMAYKRGVTVIAGCLANVL
ncbi:phospholipase D-like domain-containing protein [Methylomusa anaerophila]|uniref:hypothetical protein n=1 Tax=Methylomusa anaerophila TaxID=1930071 RepID=UPI0013157809|nr:hypothetical protein [Methylomusa anaerophila]